MMNTFIRLFVSFLLCSLLVACDGFFEKDNTPPPTPLTSFTPEVHPKNLWLSHTNFGVADEYLKLKAAVTPQTIFTAGRHGIVTATDRMNGSNHWRSYTQLRMSGGPTAYDNLVFFGTRNAEVVALSQLNGKIIWRTPISSEVLAAPSASNGIVLVKSIDGRITALSSETGHILWTYQQSEPTLILRSSSSPQMTDHSIVAGFANGNLAKLTLKEGSLIWRTTVARPEGSFAIQRMVDIDSDPIVQRNRIYAATYQGNISALNLSSGSVYWSHPISSYTGIAADEQRVYVSDAAGSVWALDAKHGSVLWQQPKLTARNITGPVIMGQYIVVADGEGYVHWLSKLDGHFVARTKVTSSGILATPVVSDGILYVVTRDGYLAAYTLS